MLKRVTTLLALIMIVAGTGDVLGQTVTTIREINAIPQSAIDAVKALGEDLTEADIEANIRSDFDGQSVQFQAVVITAPQNSGLSSFNSSRNGPSRVHYFVRDVNAETEGNAGMTIQVVDGNWDTSGSIDLAVGDVVTMTGDVAYFGTGIQFSPESIQFDGTIGDLSIDASILDPVTVTVDDLNMMVGTDQWQTNWDNFNTYNQEYVRIEGVEVFLSPNRTDSRPNWVLRDPGTGTVLQNDDVSIRYRNDRNDYPNPPFNVPDDDFVGPPPGATVNIQGIAILRTGFDPNNLFTPDGGNINIVPWTDADLEITASPPNITPNAVSARANTTDGITLSADVEADPSRNIVATQAIFSTTSNSTEQTVAGVNTSGATYEFDIPGGALADGDFLTYRFSAEDNTGAVSETPNTSIRVIDGAISSIAQIQETADGGEGDSPFRGFTLETDITATVQLDPATGFTVLQDDAGAAPWSGIWVEDVGDNVDVAALAVGDQINITSATVYEGFGVTYLDAASLVFTVVPGKSGDPIASKTVTTDIFADLSVAEAHEGIMLYFESPFIADNDLGFGEFLISSDGSVESGVRVDDASDLFPGGFDPSAEFVNGEQREFVEAPMWYSFGDFKLAPASLESIGPVVGTSTEEWSVPAAFVLKQNYPNPFNPTTRIEFDVTSAGSATLEVFDVLGRKVRTLLDGNVSVGTQTVSFNATGLPSGLYIYRLSAGADVQTRKMLLMK
ncbi:MAG: T9SS type A sorting domain-containing protein [Rhodothermales bacterium]|nr:T9SS type A sorting domain-containing protein [Rhodothermales bacterium]